MSRNRRRGLYLLEQIFGIDVSKTILRQMIIRVSVFIFTPVILDLHVGGYALLTEGALVASVTVGEYAGLEVNRIGINNSADHLREG